MSNISRRQLITTGLAAAAGVAGIGAVVKIAGANGLIPPDAGVLYGAGEALTYAAQRLLIRHSMAQEFSRDKISAKPFANEVDALPAEFARLQAGGFGDWRLKVDGMVSRPQSYSVADLKRGPNHSQITMVACEEGWDYIAEWNGIPLETILRDVGAHPSAKYVVYQSIQPEWYESIDMADALHPQTIIAHGMNGAELPVPFGGPLRMRVPRQLGYKSVKYITRITVTDSLRPFGKGLGGIDSDNGYAWYAGI
jgi:DMSO/TMAO reductase YedYZ molybdopterin-dependent catalytic subunit